MNCASIDQLFALTQNQLPVEQAQRIHVHLDTGCVECRDRLNQLHQMQTITNSPHFIKPPDRLPPQATRLFAGHQPNPRQTPLKRLPAVLLVDSFAEGQPLGFRSIGSMSRQMLFRAGHYDINLSLDYVEQHRAIDIMGQPVPLGASLDTVAGAEVELLRESTIAGTTQSNEFGAFILSTIPEGIYDLRIKLTDTELDVLGLKAVVHPHGQ